LCQNITMAQFADKLGSIAGGYVDHPVVDQTGIEGAFDFPLNFSPVRALRPGAGAPANGEASDPNGAISLFEAIDKQLGLKLEKRQHPMPVLVIDHVEEKPTDN
ncbi:MAG: TIGR03435 family protein, partial [Acidobacteriota bacterium]|nr:TIGR03435 family protein [Acidobacteriota bacterium]